MNCLRLSRANLSKCRSTEARQTAIVDVRVEVHDSCGVDCGDGILLLFSFSSRFHSHFPDRMKSQKVVTKVARAFRQHQWINSPKRPGHTATVANTNDAKGKNAAFA